MAQGNHVYQDVEIYDPNGIKQEFLKNYEEQTRKTYSRVFYKSAELERKKNMDLCRFNLEDLEKIMWDLNPITIAASRSNLSTLNAYMSWAIKNGFRGNSINPLDEVETGWYKQFVDKSVQIYVSKDYVYNLALNVADLGCRNAQDGVILMLLFEGLDTHSICHLMKSDVDFDHNMIFRIRDKNGKVIRENYPVSRECISLIRKAIDEQTYLKKNGEAEVRANQTEDSELIDNEFVVRSIKTKRVDPVGAVAPSVIYRRLTIIAELFDNPYLTSKNIYKSGQIYEGYKLWKRDGVLEKEQYLQICEKYDIPKIKNGKWEFYNWSPLQDWVNMENIEDLYADELEESSNTKPTE